MIALDSVGDLELAFYSAISMAGTSPRLDCQYSDFKSLKATAELKGGTLTARASVGFMAAPQDVLNGLALHLVSRIYRKKPAGADYYIDKYKEFMTRESTARLNSAIRRQKQQTLEPQGRHWDLNDVLASVMRDYSAVLGTTKADGISWSSRLGGRVLAIHDESFNTVFVNDSFDSPKVPQFVLEYLVYHELLHAKHGALYQRGESLRRMVHTGDFRRDEEKFLLFKEAHEWLDANWRRIAKRR
jgi:hypothetical protein